MTTDRQVERVRLMREGHAPASVAHGRPSTYTNWGCRCPECTAANARVSRRRYRRRKLNDLLIRIKSGEWK